MDETMRECQFEEPDTHARGAVLPLSHFYKPGTDELPQMVWMANYCADCRSKKARWNSVVRLERDHRATTTESNGLPVAWEELIERAKRGRALPVSELATKTGLSYHVLLTEIHEGRLGHVKVGSRYFVTAPAFQSWLDGQGYQ